MKKLIVLFNLIILFIGAKAQTSLPDSTQVTLGKVYTDVKTSLNELGSALKVGADHVYRVLVKQQVVISITLLVQWIAVILLSIVYTKLLVRVNTQSDQYIVIFFITGLILAGWVMILICLLNKLVTGFVNPEYGAIKEIINFVK